MEIMSKSYYAVESGEALKMGLDSCSASAGSDSEEELLGSHAVVVANKARRDDLQGMAAAKTTASNNVVIIGEKSGDGMSPLRCALFIASLLLCLLTIIVFLWVIPCDMSPCQNTVSEEAAPSSHAWEAPLENFEAYGPVQVVGRLPPRRGRNVVLMGENPDVVNCYHIMCLKGSTGRFLWDHRLGRRPHYIDCTMLDVNGDGIIDCVIAGEQHLLKAINPLSGMTLWNVAVTGDNGTMTMAALLPDVTGDGVPDLVVGLSSHSRSELLLISGSGGHVVGRPLPCPSVCLFVTSIIVESHLVISYTCQDNHNKLSQQTVLLSELLRVAGDLRMPVVSGNKVGRGANAGEAHVDGHRLMVDNQGHCPDHCRVQIVVKDRHNHTLYNRSLGDVYGTAPIPLSVGNVKGFLIKCLHVKEKGTAGSSSSNNKGIGWVVWTERVALITFNDSDVHVVNISQRSFVQLCNTTCRPDHRSAYQSMKMTDLDGDGSNELISVTSSYEDLISSAGPIGSQWQLQSHVTVVRLEARLPLLFDQGYLSI